MSNTLPVYEDSSGRQHRNPWVEVIFVQGVYAWEEEDRVLVAAYEARDYDGIVDYLAGWDFGHETDAAHTVDDDPRTPPGIDTFHEVTLVDDQLYILTENRALDYLCLYRRPLDWADLEFQHGGHHAPISGAWFCDTCQSPMCELADD